MANLRMVNTSKNYDCKFPVITTLGRVHITIVELYKIDPRSEKVILNLFHLPTQTIFCGVIIYNRYQKSIKIVNKYLKNRSSPVVK